MITRSISAFLLVSAMAQAVIVDRIAIIAGKKIVKDSDIANDLRLTAFLNHEALTFSPAARKKAADRLLEQGFIRDELEAGDYPRATVAEAQETLNNLIKSGYRTEAAYKSALAAYGISDEDLKARLLWQLTVLRFIDARFRSSALVTDDQIRQYYDSHRQQFGNDLNAARGKIEDLLTGERTNKAFYDWLDQQRQQTTIRYLEDSLK
jgi:peptidyl-prolyl cis-trans isomerase SurA